MEKSKLIELLKTFSKEENKSFNDFVRSPFFNKEKVLINLADYLSDYHPLYNSSEIEKEKVFRHLYPSKKYNDALMRNIISDTLRLAEKFMISNALRADGFRENMLLLEDFRNRKLQNQFLKQKEKTSAEIEKNEFKNESYYDLKTELSLLHQRFLRETEKTLEQRNKLLQETSDLITASSLIKLIYYNNYMLTVQNNVANLKYSLNLAEEIDSFLENSGSKYIKLPYIEGYWLSFKLMQSEDVKYFYKLRNFLGSNLNVVNKLEIKNIFTILENFCYKKITEGNVEFVKEQFMLYKESVENGSYLGIFNYISSTFFMSIVVTGFEAGEFDWTEKFIEIHIDDVKEENRNDSLHFCTALKYYWMKDYENSLITLAKVRSEEFALKQNIKSLTLKIYFDMNETEPFYSHVDTYKHFILNNKLVHDTVRTRVNNFINYSKRLFDLKNIPKKEREIELAILKKVVSENNALINKIWLIKKIDETVKI